MSTSRPPFSQARLVQAFRGEARSPVPLHPLERALVVTSCVQLCFLAWALGGRTPWAQIVALGLGLVSLLLAVLPRRYDGELAGPQGPFILHPWSRLLRFAPFWIGLLLLAYVACQALNPALSRVTAGIYWWLVPVEHVTWLPSGVDAPFERMNAWRVLVIWGGVWSLCCALAAGLTRRAAVHAILTALIVNGALLALVGILQKVTHAEEVLWWIPPVAETFLATFFYENHGGAYFNLIVVLAVAMTAWHHLRSRRRVERSSPAPACAFAALVVSALVFMSGARASMILLGAFLLVGALVHACWRLRGRAGASHPVVTALLPVGTALVVVLAGWLLQLDKGVGQLHELTTKPGQRAEDFRGQARRATMDLFEAKPAAGWGAGSFRHAFPITQRNYPLIHRAQGQFLVWNNAHNDYAQALAEFGVAGFALLCLLLLAILSRALRNGALTQPFSLVFLLGLGLPLAHAWVDFPLYNTAILTTFCASFVLLTRWLELETVR
jgi:O-antigen ligase